MAERMGEWYAFTRNCYCRRLTLYDTMAWPAHTLQRQQQQQQYARGGDDVVYAVAPFGGPVAMLRPPPTTLARDAQAAAAAVVVVSATDMLSDYVDVYTSAGEWRACASLDRLALGDVLGVGWTHDGDLYALTSAHACVLFRLEHLYMTTATTATTTTSTPPCHYRPSCVMALHEQDDDGPRGDDSDAWAARAASALPRVTRWCLTSSGVVYADARGWLRGVVARSSITSSGDDDVMYATASSSSSSSSSSIWLRLSPLHLRPPSRQRDATSASNTSTTAANDAAVARDTNAENDADDDAVVTALDFVWPLYAIKHRRTTTSASARDDNANDDDNNDDEHTRCHRVRVAAVYAAVACADAYSDVYMLYMHTHAPPPPRTGGSCSNGDAATAAMPSSRSCVRGRVRLSARVVALRVCDSNTDDGRSETHTRREDNDNRTAATATARVRVACMTSAGVLYVVRGDMTAMLLTLHMFGHPHSTMRRCHNNSKSNSNYSDDDDAAEVMLPHKLDWCTSSFVLLHYRRSRRMHGARARRGGDSDGCANDATSTTPFAVLVCVLPHRVDVRCERVTWYADDDDDDDDSSSAASWLPVLSTSEIDGVRVLTRRACFLLQAVPSCLVRLCRIQRPWTLAAELAHVWQQQQEQQHDDNDDERAGERALAYVMAQYAMLPPPPASPHTTTAAAACRREHDDSDDTYTASAALIVDELLDAAAYELDARQQATLLSAALAVYKLWPPERGNSCNDKHNNNDDDDTLCTTTAAASSAVTRLSRRVDDVVRRARVLRVLHGRECGGCHVPLTIQQYSVLTGCGRGQAWCTHAWPPLPAQRLCANDDDDEVAVVLGRLAYSGYYAQALDVATLSNATAATRATLLTRWACAKVATSSNNNSDNSDNDDDALYGVVQRVLQHAAGAAPACCLAVAHVAQQHGRGHLARRLALDHRAYKERTLWLLLHTHDRTLALLCAAASSDGDLLHLTLAVALAQQQQQQRIADHTTTTTTTTTRHARARDAEVARVLLASPVLLSSLLHGATSLPAWHGGLVRLLLLHADAALQRRLAVLLAYTHLRGTLSRCGVHDMRALQQCIATAMQTATKTTATTATAATRVLSAPEWAGVCAVMRRAAQLQPRRRRAGQVHPSAVSPLSSPTTTTQRYVRDISGDNDDDGDATTVTWLSDEQQSASSSSSSSAAAAVLLLRAPTTTPHDAAAWLRRHGDVAAMRTRFAARYADARFAHAASVVDVLQLLYTHGDDAAAAALQRRFALSPSRSAHARLRALCELRRWHAVEQLLGTPPAPPPAVRRLLQHLQHADTAQSSHGDATSMTASLVRAAASAAVSMLRTSLRRGGGGDNNNSSSSSDHASSSSSALVSPCGVKYASAVQVLYECEQFALATRYVSGTSHEVAERCAWYVQLHAPRAALDEALAHESLALLQHIMQACPSDAQVQSVGQAYLQALR